MTTTSPRRNRAIISLANNTGRYKQLLERQEDSLIEWFEGDYLHFNSEEEVGAPLHRFNPYAFKIYAFDVAISRGYNSILWIDSSVYAVNEVEPVFDHIEQNGYLMQEAGQYVGWWANDYTLDYFGLDRDSQMTAPMYGNAGLLGLDFTNITARKFFSRWTKSMLAGCFKGEWHNKNKTESEDERSIIANEMGLKYVSGEEWLEYKPPSQPAKSDKIIFGAQG